MLGRRGARAGPGMPRGWTALCLLSLLPSGFTDNLTTTATVQLTTLGTTSVTPTNLSSEETATPSTFGSTSPYSVSLGSNGTTATISETTVNFTSTSEVPLVAGTTNSSGQSQTSLAVTVPTTLANFSTSEMTVKPSVSPGNVSDPSLNHTSLETPTTETYVSPTPTPHTIKVGELGEKWHIALSHHMCTGKLCLPLLLSSSPTMGFGSWKSACKHTVENITGRGRKGRRGLESGDKADLCLMFCILGSRELRGFSEIHLVLCGSFLHPLVSLTRAPFPFGNI
uniref:Uncharacterized protein n=1 Tax=Prolemur simus TaxID=1328070 RepID=A0A8C8ZZD5_PROSS